MTRLLAGGYLPGENQSEREIFREKSSRSLGPGFRAAFVGVILGIDALGHCLAMATLCFAAGLTSGLGFAVSAFALSSAIVTLVLMHKSGFRSALGICQDTSIALLAPAVIFAASRSTGGLESQIATAFAVIGLSTILSGLAFLLVGNHRLGRIVRLFPYPVAAGFLASSGWLLLFAALTISTGAESFSSVVTHAVTFEAARNLFPALALALGLLAAMRFGAGTTGLLVVLMSFVFGFYLCMWALEIDQQNAISLGFLPKIQNLGSEVSLWTLPAQVNWVLVAQTLPVIAAVVALNLVGLLLNTSGVELATHQDVDANHELQISGWANLLIGTFGGLTGFITSGSSILATRLTQNKMALQLSYIAVMLLGCVLASQIVAIIPSFVAAGLLMFIGLSMLGDWLIASFHRMVPGDWAVVIGIVGLTAAFGILPAIAIGVLGAVFLFAYRYARLPVIRYETDGIRRRSTVDRSAEDEQLLTNHGARILIMHLQGALFFGSIDMLISRIRSDLSKSTGPQILILDFASVTAVDAATCAAVQRLRHVVATKGAVLHISGLSRDVSAVFERWGDWQVSPHMMLWPVLDEALEAAEEALLFGLRGGHSEQSIIALLQNCVAVRRAEDLLAYLQPIDLGPGESLIKTGAATGDVFILETGRLGVWVKLETGRVIRVRSIAPGAVVGEMAHYLGLGRTADVSALVPSRVWKLSTEALTKIEAEDRDLAAMLHVFLAQALAVKLLRANALMAQVDAIHGPQTE